MTTEASGGGGEVNENPLFDDGLKRHQAKKKKKKQAPAPGGPVMDFAPLEKNDDDDDDEDKEDDDEGNETMKDSQMDWQMIELEHQRRLLADELWNYFSDETQKSVIEDVQLAPRMWESSCLITCLQNIESKSQYFFYVVTFGHVNRNRKVAFEMRRRTLYSAGFHLKSSQNLPLTSPVTLWQKKLMTMSYGELDGYQLTIDMWTTSEHTFNTFYATATITMEEVVSGGPDIDLTLQRSISDRKAYEVQKVRLSIRLSEIFDCEIRFESWSFIPSKTFSGLIKSLDKQIHIRFPRGQAQWQSLYSAPSSTGFWSNPFTLNYRGTILNLQSSYFVIKLYAIKPGKVVNSSILVGTCVFSLKAIADYPLFKGSVKSLDASNYIQGEMVGHLRNLVKSMGAPNYEDPNLQRPKQSVGGVALVDQLDTKEQHLIFRLNRCDNLPPVNLDTGTCKPLVKVKWDGMTFEVSSKQETLRPVFNQNFYFPVRVMDATERTNPKYVNTCLPMDLVSKGKVVIEVWDSDEVSSEFLGGTTVHLCEIFRNGKIELKGLTDGLGGNEISSRLPDGRPAAFRYVQMESEQDFFAGPTETQLENSSEIAGKYDTLVYKGNGVELTGCNLAVKRNAKPIIFFELYFIPPLPKECIIHPPPTDEESISLLQQMDKKWTKNFAKWQRIYCEWFPHATPKQRRFTAVSDHPHSAKAHPLPSFICPIALPIELATRAELTHWISCIPFTVSSKQKTTGNLPRWISPNYFLTTRKGGVNDHAVLLCSCLLGMDYDAYVCKGTVKCKEYCWVATRHKDNWVILWDVNTKVRYHLPERWGFTPATTAKTDDSSWELDDFLISRFNQIAETVGADLLDPSKIMDEAFDGNVADISMKNAQEPAADPDKSKVLWEAVKETSETLPIAPKQRLLDPETTLCFIPYDTIEIVFNNHQLWGNLQNHHPACINYDFNNSQEWKPYMNAPTEPIDRDIYVSPPMTEKSCNLVSIAIQCDVLENIRVMRGRKGLESLIDHNEEKAAKLEKFLDLMEFRLQLDVEFNPGIPEKHVGWSSWGIFGTLQLEKPKDLAWFERLSKELVEPNDADELPQKNLFQEGDPQHGAILEGDTTEYDMIYLGNEVDTELDGIQPRIDDVLDHSMIIDYDEFEEHREKKSSSKKKSSKRSKHKEEIRYERAPVKAVEKNVEMVDATQIGFQVTDDSNEAILQRNEAAAMNFLGVTADDKTMVEDELLSSSHVIIDETTEEPTTTTEQAAKPVPPRKFKMEEPDQNYAFAQRNKWLQYYKLESAFYTWQKSRFPVKLGHTFCGFSIHFSVTDPVEIRSYLLNANRFKKLLYLPTNDISYIVKCKIYPFLGGVVSCWVFIGCEIPCKSKMEKTSKRAFS